MAHRSAGLDAAGNRRVRGLRREEVAQLASISADYYPRLEQGRLASASESVLDALANALRLSDDERKYLYRLANKGDQGQKDEWVAAIKANKPPSMNRYQLKRLILGNARSRAPIIRGTK